MRRVLLGLALLAGAACSDGERVAVGDAADDGPLLYEVSATVLEDATHGPMLCANIATSDPPQCGNVDVIGWSWEDVDGEESRGGTTWGDYHVVGTWDGTALTLTERPGPPEVTEDPGPAGFPTPCDDVAGRRGEPSPAFLEHAQAMPGYAGQWHGDDGVFNVRTTRADHG
jgi:hypothetical protein